MKKNNKGFSLVELIVVIAIMAILAAVAIPTFAVFIRQANFAADRDFMNQAEDAFKLAYAADVDFEVSDIEVTISGGKATAIKCDGVTVLDDHKDADVSNSVTQQMIDVANAIDWDYNFKTQKDGTFVLDENAKELVEPKRNTQQIFP